MPDDVGCLAGDEALTDGDRKLVTDAARQALAPSWPSAPEPAPPESGSPNNEPKEAT
jgi:hypothetical protein